MKPQRTNPCAGCERLQRQLDKLQQRLGTLEQQFAQVQQHNEQLQQQLAAARKDSSTSSKPPSSDIVKPPKTHDPAATPLLRGGQPGHAKHEREPFATTQLNGGTEHYCLELCPECGHGLQECHEPARVVQQVELPTSVVVITEHQAHPAWCPCCAKRYYGVLPAAVQAGGLVGPRLTAFIAFLKGVAHASFSVIRKTLRDVLGVQISRGQLVNVLHKVSNALEPTYQELLDAVPLQARLNIDETGHKDQGERWWTWCFRAELYTLFKIDPHRSAEVLIEVLGEEFAGVFGCDYYSAYRRYMKEFNVLVQFCLAHLIRDIKYVTTLPGQAVQAYAQRLLTSVRQLFAVLHRQDELSAPALARALGQARAQVLQAALSDVPAAAACQNLARRFRQHGEAYFQFLTTPGLEPTNNLAEQAIRFVVLDRRITQGTRGEKGRQWCERIWTVIASCAQQGKSVFDYLCAAVTAAFTDQPSPSLLEAN